MKIELIGTGCTWTKKLATSYIVDDHIMLDCPQGSFKTLLAKHNLESIDTVIISHYHSDHWADFHLFVEALKHKNFTNKIKVFAPIGFWEKFECLAKAFYLPKTLIFAKEHISFNQLKNGKVFKIGRLNFVSYEVKHIPDSFGFVASDGETTVGFSCDTSMCDNLIKIIKKSKVVFIDMASTQPNDKHLCVNEVINLQKEFENIQFIPVHLSNHSTHSAKNKLSLPHDGQVFYI